ncbi:MAG: hypothetical protein KKB79_03290 [Nanoarchaeota archaeon]|nr:hypothetical protein [Nanoarchaeota archaeon]
MAEYNEPELRKKLLRVYERFIKKPSDEKNLDQIKELDGSYGSLTAVNQYLLSKPISEEMNKAIGFLYNVWSKSFGESKEELQNKAREIVVDLRKR